MRITGLGHAGMFIETTGGTILCDPVIKSSFYGSWFVFPDNRALDWERYGKADFLYISHRHRDHFDPWMLETFVRKDIEVLLPEYPTDDLEQDLRRLGYDNITYTRAGEIIQRGELKLMITPLRAPSDGPIGDSSLSVDDGTASILNQNDSHPLDLEKLLSFGKPEAYFTQFSGAIWWPMVYDLPQDAKVNFAHLKREAQHKRAMFYIEKVDAPHVYPMAGPPMFLRDELFRYNGLGEHNDSIFTDQAQFLARMKEEAPQYSGHVFIPGTVVTISGGEQTVEQTLYTDAEIDRMFTDKWGYLQEQRASRQEEIRAEEASRAPVLPPDEMLAELKAWWEPLLRRGRIFREGVGGPVRMTIGELDLLRRLPQGQGARVRGGGDQLLVHDPRRPRLDEHRRARDRLVELDLPVDAVRSRTRGQVQRVHLHVLQVPLTRPHRVRRELVRRTVRRHRGHPARGLDRAAPLPAPARRSLQDRQDRGRRAHLLAARLEVGPEDGQVPVDPRSPDPRQPGGGRPAPRRGIPRRLTSPAPRAIAVG